MAWVLAVLAVSERLPLLSYLLSAAVLAHAMFALIGYCFLNSRVRRNLYVSLLRCIGKKVPLDSSEVTTGGTSSHSHQGGSASQQHSVWKNRVFIYLFLFFYFTIYKICGHHGSDDSSCGILGFDTL
jgi:hypothetical protein